MYTISLAGIAASLAIVASAAVLPNLDSSIRVRDDGGFSLPMRKRSLGSTSSLDERSLSPDLNDRWWISLGVGTKAQALNFLPDTGANSFSVISTLLPANEMGNGLYYNPNASSSAVQVPGYSYTERFGSGYSDSGVVFNETITLSDQTFTSIPLCVQTQASSPTENDRSGNLGLNRETGQSTSPQRLPTFMQSIRTKLPKWLFTTSYNLYTNTGELDFGYIDTSKYTGTLTYANATDTTFWYTYFSGLVVKGVQQQFSFRVLIDTGGGDANIPKNVLDAYFSQVPTAAYSNNTSTYSFPCNATLPPLTFVVAGLQLNVPAISWVYGVLGSTGQCSSKIYASSDNNAYLGDPFIAGVFLVFDLAYDRIGFANRPAISSIIPTKATTETVSLCPNGNTPAQTFAWTSAACYSLQNTPVYHNVTEFSQTAGSCTLYSDTACGTPIAGAIEVQNSYPGNGTTLSAGSFMCLNPNFYKPSGSGEMQYCYGPQFTNNCRVDQWTSFVCNPLPASYVNKIGSAGPYPGYCTWYIDSKCAKPIQGDAVMPYPGEGITPWGNQTGSYMCI